MRAAVMYETGKPFEIRDDVELREMGPGEVEVRIAASGICRSDLSVLDGNIGFGKLPSILGHEGAGVIERVGKDVTTLAPGDHVILAFRTACGHCRNCIETRSHLCSSTMLYTAPPMFTVGGEPTVAGMGIATFAERSIAPVEAVVKIEPEIPLDLSCLIGCGVTTGVGAALNTAKVRPGDSVVVIGCGGVGLNVIQGARIAGATNIVAVDLIPDKLELAKQFGATHAVLSGQLDSIKQELTGGEGFDFGFEVIGLPATIRQAYEATRRGGSTVVVGTGPRSQEVSFNVFELLNQGRAILPSPYGGGDIRVDFPRLIQLWQRGQLNLEDLVTNRISLDEINSGVESVRAGEVARSVIVYE